MAPVFYAFGWALTGFGAFLLVPLLWELQGPTGDWQVFAITAFISGFIGGALLIASRRDEIILSVRQTFVLTALVWVGFSIIAMFPFAFSATSYGMSGTDALFEAVSGISTTGATVMSGLDEAPKGLLVWRSVLQWLGGIGIVVYTMTILPYVQVGGMQVFHSETANFSEKITNRMGQVAAAIGAVYIGLTITCFVAYFSGGMTSFDAMNHAMTTVSTGGFSTHDASFGHYDSAWLEWWAVVFMIAGGTPLLLYVRFFRRRKFRGPLWSQTKVFWKTLFILLLVLTLFRLFTSGGDFTTGLREVVFNITSIVTTTGYVTADYTLWGGVFITVVYILMAIGGCTGSTSGGIKIFRMQVLMKLSDLEIRRLSHPHGAFSAMLGGKKVKSPIFRAIGNFMMLYGLLFALVTLGLSFTGLDFMTSLSGAASALSNVGPGLGDVIGPMGTYAALEDPAKWILSFAMLAGRLEIFTFLVLFTPVFWREFA
jgi:trk system potassium uptake protein TrkH